MTPEPKVCMEHFYTKETLEDVKKETTNLRNDIFQIKVMVGALILAGILPYVQGVVF